MAGKIHTIYYLGGTRDNVNYNKRSDGQINKKYKAIEEIIFI